MLYCDIADFYNQIYHHAVENQLAESSFPNQAIKWIIKLLESTTAGVSRGIPIGPHAAHLIAECTLIPIDNNLKTNGVEFIRYADDLVIFCTSENEARASLRKVATTLDKQQRLLLQQHKTRIFNREEFTEHCHLMIEDRPISTDEDSLLQIIRKYSGGNPYAVVTYNQVAPDDWKQFSREIVTGIIDDYLRQEEVDYVHLRWFFRRLAQVGHPAALQVVIDHIQTLEPCLPSVCSYISSIQEVPQNEWKTVGEGLLKALESDSISNTEFARLSILSLFSRNEHIDHFVKLAQRYGSADGYTRREILIAAKANAETDWLREQKESFRLMDTWQSMAFIYCMSILPEDERRVFLARYSYSSPFEQELATWARDKRVRP